MVSVTTSPAAAAAEPQSPKKRKRDDPWGKENALRLAQAWRPEPLDARYSGKGRPTSYEKLTNKRRRSISSAQPALTSTSLPNTPIQSPQTTTSPVFRSAGQGSRPTRCHICLRPEGVTLRVAPCDICDRGMCQVCTRLCTVCERERCSKCCVEEGEEGDPVCFICLEEKENEEDDDRALSDGNEMTHNGD